MTNEEAWDDVEEFMESTGLTPAEVKRAIVRLLALKDGIINSKLTAMAQSITAGSVVREFVDEYRMSAPESADVVLPGCYRDAFRLLQSMRESAKLRAKG